MPNRRFTDAFGRLLHILTQEFIAAALDVSTIIPTGRERCVYWCSDKLISNVHHTGSRHTVNPFVFRQARCSIGPIQGGSVVLVSLVHFPEYELDPLRWELSGHYNINGPERAHLLEVSTRRLYRSR
jgi:hypothetical protein